LSGPWRVMVLSMTSTEPPQSRDWLYVQSPRTSALAGCASSAKIATGANISQRLLRPTPMFLHPTCIDLQVLVLVLANHC